MQDELQLADPTAVKALFDPLRYRLFGLLRTPRSVGELAQEVGMPPDRLYYHVRRLIECGLVHQVDIRVSGRHTERIFGRVAARIRFSGEGDLGSETPLRVIADELDAGLRSAGDLDPALFSYHVISLTSDRARELEERLRSLIFEYDDGPPPSGDARTFGVLGVLTPLPERGTG